jgi:hypothetical protein
MGPHQKLIDFETNILTPALAEVCASTRLLAEYTAQVINRGEPAPDEPTEALCVIAMELDWVPGTALVLANRDRRPDWPVIAGRYAMMVMYVLDGADCFASPAVGFWMRFDQDLHFFDHRYDNAIARHPLEDITRAHILNHILGSFDFYKIFATAPKPPPGF